MEVGRIKVWRFDKDGYYVGPGEAMESPLELNTGTYLVGKYETKLEPPEPRDGSRLRFVSGAWCHEPAADIPAEVADPEHRDFLKVWRYYRPLVLVPKIAVFLKSARTLLIILFFVGCFLAIIFEPTSRWLSFWIVLGSVSPWFICAFVGFFDHVRNKISLLVVMKLLAKVFGRHYKNAGSVLEKAESFGLIKKSC